MVTSGKLDGFMLPQGVLPDSGYWAQQINDRIAER